MVKRQCLSISQVKQTAGQSKGGVALHTPTHLLTWMRAYAATTSIGVNVGGDVCEGV